MPPALTPEAWAQIRHDYEHTERPLAEICDDHNISTGTLRDRVRRWRWTPRRLPISLEGPAPLPAPWPESAVPPMERATPLLCAEVVADAVARQPGAEPSVETETDAGGIAHSEPAAEPSPPWQAATGPTAADTAAREHAMVRGLQGAIARVLPAIETTLHALGQSAQHPREMERAARALAALTRTLRELNGLLAHHAAAAEAAERKTVNLHELRTRLARKLEALVMEKRAEDELANEEAADEADESVPDAPGEASGGASSPDERATSRD